MSRDCARQPTAFRCASIVVTTMLAQCWLAALPVCAQQLSLRHYNVADGLAQSRVTAIHQDRKGYLWFGTHEGLSRFDGYRFTNYGVLEGLGHALVNDITEDRQGRLWVGTNGSGVARLIDDPSELLSSRLPTAPGTRPKFINFHVGNSPESNNVNALLFDAADTLWCATDDGLYRAAAGQPGELKFTLVAPHQPIAVAMTAFADRHGRLWFGIADELIEVVQGQIIKYGPADGVGSHTIVSVVEDQQGRLLLANERAVFEFITPPNGQSRGRWQPFPLALTSDQIIHKMAIDAAGTLWLGTENGLIKYHAGKQTLYTDVQGLSSNVIRTLRNDRDGNLWVGTQGSGVCKLSGGLITSFTKTAGLPNQYVSRVIEDHQGRIYASVAAGGLVEIVEGRAVPVPGSQLAPFSTSTPFQDSRRDWWIVTAEGLFRFAGPELQLRRGRKFSAGEGITLKINEPPLMAEDPFGHLLVTSSLGLYRLDLAQAERAVFERIPVDIPLRSVVAHLSDRQGAVWLGGHEVLARLMKGKSTILQPSAGLPEVNTRAFFQDSRGWLWIGLRFKGVSLTKDPRAETPQFINYSTQTGLASDTVWAITEDDRGRIYLSTGKGLDQLDPITGRIRHFGTRDGLASEAIGHSLKDRNGNIWLATTQGLSKLNPRAERIPDPPPIYLSRVQVAGEELPLAETGALHIPEFELPAARNNLFVEYVALSFQGEQRLRYQYKLEGVDADWSQPSEARSVNYARLAPGAYQFLVRAINQEGALSPEPAVLRFSILPPLWHRWWFLTLAALSVGLAAYALYRYRVARLIELERVRTRIASDLHDDIGANLTKIALLSEVAQQQLGVAGQANGSPFPSIAHISRESVAAMGDIVWAINPKRDSLRDLARRMRGFASDVFTSRNIEFRFHAPDLDQDLRLGPELRRHVFLIFKEAVNNLVRHSACTEAEIELRLEGGQLKLRVHDNGQGFDPQQPSEGNGLASMKRRASASGSTLEMHSQPEQGTTIVLLVPVARRSWI